MSETNPADFATNKSPSRAAKDTSGPNNTTPYTHLPPGAGAPAKLGRFEVRGLLGEGAFARVYLGFDSELEREVAIKVPKADELTPEFREAFIRENRLAAIIHHPNICPIFEVGSDGNVPYLVMRVIPTTLAGLLKRVGGALPPRTAVAVTRKLALGLTAAHAQNIVHRDLKPANVLYDEPNREVLIADFGLARFADRASAASNGVPKGTPAYMAPEQARGLAAEVGTPSDIYALGVILYELLTGRVPFTGSVWEVMRDHCETLPEPPSRVVPNLDPKLDSLCLKAMAKSPASRYPSAKALATALAEYLRGSEQSGGYTAPPPTEPGPKKKPIVALPVAEEIFDLPDGDPDATDPDPLPPKPPRAIPVREEHDSGRKSRKAPREKRPVAEPGRRWLLPLVIVVVMVGAVIAAMVAAVTLDWSETDLESKKKRPAGPTDTTAKLPAPEPATKAKESPDPIATAKQPVKAVEPVKWPYPTPKPIEPVTKAPEPKKNEPEPKKSEAEPKRVDSAEAELQRDWTEYKRSILTTGSSLFVKGRGPVRWRAWKQAAEANSAAAMVMYGHCLLRGAGPPKDLPASFDWFRKGAELGDPVAMNNVAISYGFGEGVAQDQAEAYKWYKKAADLGDPTAINNVGWCYQTGGGVTKDLVEALRLYRKAADLGSSIAMNNIGACYDEGTGVPKDRAEAVKWFRKAADLGERRAMSNLGYSYLNGDGVAKNEAAAVAWFQKAAAADHGGAMNELGRCYRMGVGVTRDLMIAVKWFRAAADAGEPVGMNNVGIMHEYGEGVAVDKVEAVKWYRKAAEGGDIYGMENLARCLENGIGGAKNAKEAAEWRAKAAKVK